MLLCFKKIIAFSLRGIKTHDTDLEVCMPVMYVTKLISQ